MPNPNDFQVYALGSQVLRSYHADACVEAVHDAWKVLLKTQAAIHRVMQRLGDLWKNAGLAHILYPDFTLNFAHYFERSSSVNLNFCPISTRPTNTTTFL